MKALVTGGGGFLGQYIVEQLVARGDQVRSLSRKTYPALDALGVEQTAGDIQDGNIVDSACTNIDVVFHTAAIAGIWGDPKTFFGINLHGTQNIVSACRKHNVQKLVFSSSPSVIFDATDQNGLDESAPYPDKWLCSYPESKAAAEKLVLDANDNEHLLTCALRPHLIWGPRDQHLIPRLIDRAQSGKLRIVGDGQNLVDNVYVENAAAAHLQAANALSPNAAICGEAYFISQGQPVKCWQWINEILVDAGLAPVKKKLSFSAAWTIGSIMEWGYRLMGWQDEPRMTRFLAAQLAKNHYYEIEKAKRDFGYAPTISHEEGMKRLKESL